MENHRGCKSPPFYNLFVMKTTFSVNLYDKDGDIYKECILLYINENTILKLKSSDELDRLINGLKNCLIEIKENYNI